MTTEEILFESLQEFCNNSSGKCKNSFFENWFTKNGRTYNFIFKQNLYVTNLQFREMIDLIRLNVKKGEIRPQVNFMTTREFTDLTANIVGAFIDETTLKEIREEGKAVSEIENSLQLICKNYGNLFENTIIIDAFYTSCIVSIPNSLEIDIQRICFQSGYVHSCGENIYTRNMKKAKYENFVGKLIDYLGKYKKPLNFIMYTHEDFPIKNKLYVNDFQKHGLDEIKFYLEKFYMQDISLLQIVEKLKTDSRLSGKINVMKKAEAKKRNTEECIWMIIDRSIGNDLKYPGDKRYYICYKQMYINENPFHIFDENKPGWINSVTIPHTLAGAMINIGKGECTNNGKKKYIVIDPFVGSGTTFLESLKYDDIEFAGGDKCNISQIVTKMNLQFFAKEITFLENLQKLILAYIKQANENIYAEICEDLKISSVKTDKFARTLLSELEDSQDMFTVTENQFAENFSFLARQLAEAIKSKMAACKQNDKWLTIANRKLIAQIFALLVWKTYKRNEFRYNTMAKIELINDSAEEFKGFLYRLLSYIHLQNRIKNGKINLNDNCEMITFPGKYTRACTISRKHVHKMINICTAKIQSNTDVIDFLKQFEKDKVDLIVTDPPYGFNTEEEKTSFSELYISFINAMVKTMNNGGQIIMCLPSISYSGKAVNIFAQKEVVSRQFMIAAQENNMIIAANEDNFPNPKEIYSFPFYWDSEKALRRDIIRFQFFKKN